MGKIILMLGLAFFLQKGGEKIISFLLARNKTVLAEYDLTPLYSHCHPYLFIALNFLSLWFGWHLPATLGGKIFSCLFLYFLIIISSIDWHYQLIFDDSVLALSALAIIATSYLPASFLDRLLAAGGAFLVMLGLFFLRPGAIGGGDVKLMFAFGLWLGTKGVISAAFHGFIIGGIAALFLLIFCRREKTDFFAYGPFLAIGAALSWLFQATNW